MTRVLPRSLLGQVMLALGAALLIAQAISAALLYQAAEQRREAALINAAAFQLMSGPRRADRPAPSARQLVRREDGVRIMRLPRSVRYGERAASPLGPGETRDPAREHALAELLAAQGVEAERIEIAVRPFWQDRQLRAAAERYPKLRQRAGDAPPDLLVVGLKRPATPLWQVAKVAIPDRERRMLPTLVLQTLIMFGVLVGLMYLVLRRIIRPLGALAERTARFAGAGEAEPPLEPTGPDDIRRLIDAHNAMQARIGTMLHEKDVMLGAIGHDLKTPLAALRVRIEAVENEAQRERMAATIEEIARTLDEILSLARVGRNSSPRERADIGALAASVVEEFEDMGETVSLTIAERIGAPVHITWLKRGLRNLVSNALRYSGAAQVAVLREGAMAVLRVEDEGPGIPEDRLADMFEPFVRGEESRNRATGGAGLGLTLARAVAEQHGGTLTIANRAEGGLRAELRFPAGDR